VLLDRAAAPVADDDERLLNNNLKLPRRQFLLKPLDVSRVVGVVEAGGRG
jgi:hypothetical protein